MGRGRICILQAQNVGRIQLFDTHQTGQHGLQNERIERGHRNDRAADRPI